MEVTKLMKRNHYEEITEQLKSLIIQGELKVGEKLPSTKELSEKFGVGRSTTREALSALKAMGLIEIRQGGGCTIIFNASSNEIELPALESLRLNRMTLLELLETRHSLEVSNAAIAAEKRTDEDLEILNGLMKEMEASIGNNLEGERTDLLFHVSLAKATQNSIMIRLFDSIMNPMEMAIREIRRVEMYANSLVAERLYDEHLMIFEAVSSCDKNLAAQRMKIHLEHVESILTKYV
jgi:GntR family transcriptional repressor for pyruvate dehydrogenase complex